MEGRRKGRKKEMREKGGGKRKETGMDRRREKQMKEDERASVGGWMEKGEEAGATCQCRDLGSIPGLGRFRMLWSN